MELKSFCFPIAGGVLSALLALPAVAANNVVANPICPDNTANFNPTLPPSIDLPPGFTASVFASGLNFPTGIAFLGDSQNFQVFVLESGHGLGGSRCNEQGSIPGGDFASNNPFTPDILVFNRNGTLIRGPLGKPTSSGGGFQPAGPAIDIGFVNGVSGGRLFATDSNQSTHGGGQNNSSRIVTVNPMTGQVTPFITDLPTGDHPTEQLAFKGGWIYWSQGSTTNSGVVGLDNNSGANQSDIPCQDIVLSNNTFLSSLSPLVATSGYSPFGTTNPGGTVKAFFNSFTGKVRQGGVRRRHPASTTEQFEQHPGLLLGLSEPVRDPLPTQRPSIGRRNSHRRGRPGRTGSAPLQQCPGCGAARSPEPRWQPGLSRMAGPLWLLAVEPGGIQSDRRHQ